jgi:hypothetical protein
MRLRDFAVVCLCWVIFGGLAEAQESRTLVTVAAPAKMDGKEFDKVRIAVNGRVKTIDPGKTAEFSVAASDDTVQTWTAAIPLSGSGHLDYTALSFGRGTWGQWPLVVFQSNGTVFDILLDGRTLGTIGVAGITEIKRGIQPNQGHTLAWRISANDVCTKNVTLPESVSRTYVCDAKTKQVAER